MPAAEVRRRAGRQAGAVVLVAILGACTLADRPPPAPGGGDGAPTASGTRAVSGTVAVTADSVNLRAGPGTGYAVIGGARRGDRLAVLGRRGAWLEIRRPRGSAWIAARLTGPPEGTRPAGEETAENPLMAPPPPLPETARQPEGEAGPTPDEAMEQAAGAPTGDPPPPAPTEAVDPLEDDAGTLPNF